MTEHSTTTPIMSGQPAPDVSLRDQHNQPVALSSFWTLRPTVLVFVRHFG